VYYVKSLQNLFGSNPNSNSDALFSEACSQYEEIFFFFEVDSSEIYTKVFSKRTSAQILQGTFATEKELLILKTEQRANEFPSLHTISEKNDRHSPQKKISKCSIE
jgi:hypothetical protein